MLLVVHFNVVNQFWVLYLQGGGLHCNISVSLFQIQHHFMDGNVVGVGFRIPIVGLVF